MSYYYFCLCCNINPSKKKIKKTWSPYSGISVTFVPCFQIEAAKYYQLLMCQYFRSKVGADSSPLTANYKDQELKRNKSSTSLKDVKSPNATKLNNNGLTDLCTPPASDCSDEEAGHAKRRKLNSDMKTASVGPPLFQSQPRFSSSCLWQPMASNFTTGQGICKLSPPSSEDLTSNEGCSSKSSPVLTGEDSNRTSLSPKTKLSMDASSALDLSVKPGFEIKIENKEEKRRRSHEESKVAHSMLNIQPQMTNVRPVKTLLSL